jgi:hypothetical protein
MTIDPGQLQVGMEVVGRDGELAGTVKAVYATEFHLDRPLARDVMVPIEAIQAIVNATATEAGNPRVLLTVRADSVGELGWPNP